jgi:vancomycin resistance protein VanJ
VGLVRATLLIGYLLFLFMGAVWASLTPYAPWWLSLASEFAFFLFAFAPITLALALVRPSRMSLCLGLAPIAIFLALYGGRIVPHPRVSASPSGREIVVYTQNLAGLYTLTERLKTEVERVRPDLLAAQEVPDYVVELQALADPILPYSALEPRPDPSGVGAWSKYPILESQAFRPADTGHLSTRLRVDLGGETLTFYSVHLNPPWPRGWDGNLKPTAFFRPVESTLRRSQVEGLISDLQKQTGPVIVAGDFNMSDRTYDYRQLSRVLTDSFTAGGTGLGHTFPAREDWWPFGSLLPPALRIDYIWLGQGLIARDVQVSEYVRSDHKGLIAHIALE